MAISAQGLRAGRAFIELALTGERQVARSLRKLQSRVQRIGRGFTAIGTFGVSRGGGLGGFASLRTLFVGTAAGAALAWPIKLASNLEVTQARFTALLGNAQDARDLISQLEQFSKISLLPINALQEGAALLAQYGVETDKIMPSIQALTEIAGGSEERFQRLSLAYAQVRSRTKLLATEVRQFAESGFAPLEEIAKATGETIQQVTDRMEDGNVSFEELDAALLAAVRTGGRFHGLLESIGSTAAGQFKILRTSFALAVRPLGQQLLPVLNEVLTIANRLMPAFERFVKENSAAFLALAKTAGVVVAAAIGFITIGLALTLVSIAAGGFVAAFGIISAVIGTMVSPLGLLLATLYGLLSVFPELANWLLRLGGSLVEPLIAKWNQLKQTVTTAIDGIVASLMKGDIENAGRIAMLGLELAWKEGTQQIMQSWIAFKNDFLRLIANLAINAERIWVKLKSTLMSTALDIGAAANKFGESDADKAGLDIWNALAKRGLEGQTTLTLKGLEAAQETFNSLMDQGTQGEIDALNQAIQDLRAQFEAAVDKAHELPVLFHKNPELEAVGRAAAGAAGGGLAFARNPEGLFDARFAKQIFGGNQVEEDQLQQLKLIKRGIQNLRGGLPVV